MKVIHIESGLGNQMLSYCELLSLKHVNPLEEFYLETLVYDIPEAAEVISQWQGYELQRVFDIQTPNIRDKFTEKQWGAIIEDIRKGEFWKKNWNWPVYFTNAFERQGLSLQNLRGDFEESAIEFKKTAAGHRRNNTLYKKFQKTWLYSNVRRIVNNRRSYTEDDLRYLFYTGDEDAFTGQKLSFMYRNNHIEDIDKLIRETFVFPPMDDEKNATLMKELQRCESVAIHARRGDLLGLNERYYKSGFFKRATNYIKHHVDNPVFYFFCDPGSSEWCGDNLNVFGLKGDDKVFFVDWNKNDESFRDMQLMCYCKHNIITISSFGWWGAYLNTNPEKITISPEPKINTTHHL